MAYKIELYGNVNFLCHLFSYSVYLVFPSYLNLKSIINLASIIAIEKKAGAGSRLLSS